MPGDVDRCPHCGGVLPERIPSQWLVAPLGDAWRLAVRVAVQAGRPVAAELRIFPQDTDSRAPAFDGDELGPGSWSAERLGFEAHVPEGGLTSRLLSQVRLESLIRDERTSIVEEWARLCREYEGRNRTTRVEEPAFTVKSVPDVPEVRDPRSGDRRRVAAYSDLELAQIANEYLVCCRKSNRPVVALAQAHGWEPEYARDMIYAARERSLLRPAGGGRPGGSLSARALQLLNEHAAPP